MKQIFLAFFLLVIFNNSYASKFQANGVWYQDNYHLEKSTDGSERWIFEYQVVDGEGYSGNITIMDYVIDPNPLYEELKGKSVPVTKIGTSAFWGTDITSVSIPGTVRIIGGGAFMDCLSLTEIDIPEGVEVIDNAVFAGCKNLGRISIPSTVKAIGMSTFRNCEKLKELFIPNSVEMMFDDLSSCYGLEKLTFEEGGAPIELSSMDLSRTPIKELIWGRNIVSDKNNPNKSMYFGGKSLERAILGNSLTFIPAYAFAGCSKLTHILMPSFLTEIRSCAFSNCTSLEQINIPSIVKVIGKHAFWNCYNLQKLSSTSEDGVFELPQDVDSISIDAFKNCSAIRELVVPFACRKMSLAFEDCYSIVKVTSYAPVPPEITKYTFENKVYNNATLICPTPEAYKVAEGWKYFGKIVASSDTSIPQISQQQDNTSIYDLKGRQRHINDGYQKGIYIVNGKKVMLSK